LCNNLKNGGKAMEEENGIKRFINTSNDNINPK
jgi:hypothetical protein